MKTYLVLKHHAWRREGVEVYLHEFKTSALDGGEKSALRPGRFPSCERAPGTHWIGTWVGPKAGMDAVAKRTPVVQPVA
jgi:hypothetical protein